MGLKVKGLLVLTTLLISSLSSAHVASSRGARSKDYYRVSSVEIEEVTGTILDPHFSDSSFKMQNLDPGAPAGGFGNVIAIGKDIVALGESIYQLVLKGKPSVITTYAPISVIPRVNGEPADIFDMEGFSIPVKKTYQIKYNNLYNATIVHFMFSIIYSYGGSYNGTGAYLTSVQVVPEYVKVLWGWEFDASMKLGGIQNVGTKANPNAGATLMIEYTASSVLESVQRTNSFFVTGKGILKPL